MSRPRILDLCCSAGGAAEGYHRAGFEVVGVDNKPQPRYPFPFVKMDVIGVLEGMVYGGGIVASDTMWYGPGSFDAIHVSPPCQKFSAMTKRWIGRSGDHPDLITPIRDYLILTGLPYIMENVVGAREWLRSPIMLCGTMFGLETPQGNQLWRHRLFEMPWFDGEVPLCNHNTASAIGVHGGGQHPNRRRTIGVYGSTGGSPKRDGIEFFGIKARRQVMGIDWMTGKELNQAIPPAYTEWIGRRLLADLEVRK